MARRDKSDDRDRPSRMALGLGIGLAGMAVGVGMGMLFAPKEGAAIRRDIRTGAKRLRHEANELSEHGAEFASRLRTAAREGVREARRHIAVNNAPRRSDLAGVAGLAEPF